MFPGVTEEERQRFVTQTHDSFIPGYTGHCPTLKFQYGCCYGSKTKEILKDIRTTRIFQDVKKDYRPQDYKSEILEPVVRKKGQFRDYALDIKQRAPRYITGYTGFIPTLNFRYGKSYSRTADDCDCENQTNQHRRIQMAENEIQRMYEAKNKPKLTSIRSKDEVQQALNKHIERYAFQDHKISPEYPPIAGYTGHIPRVKGNEESLSQRYNTVVRRGLSLLQQEKERVKVLKKAQNKVVSVLHDYEELHKTS